MKSRHPFLALLVAAAASFAATGCDSFDNDSGKSKTSSRDDRISRPSDARSLDGIPTRADRVAQGKDQRLIYTAPEDGTLYVYDATDRKLLFSGPLYRNEEFLMVPDGNRIEVNGRKAGTYNLHTDRKYELYFDRDNRSSDSRTSIDRF
jgi:hypothetical protein